MHLVGFIIRIYHDARSPKRQIIYVSVICSWYNSHNMVFLINSVSDCYVIYTRVLCILSVELNVYIFKR